MKMHLLRRAVPAALAAALVGVGGCLPTEYRGPVFWEGSLVSPASSPMIVTGQVFMVANVAESEIGITLDLDWPDMVFSWHVRNGVCSGSGQRLAPLPEFGAFSSTDEGPHARAVLRRRVAVDATYSAELFEGPNTTGQLLACADLIRL
jgi:hypothetical protein